MKKLLFLLAMLLLIPTAIAVAKDATLINFITGDRVAVEVNSQEAQQYFADDYMLETSYGYTENDGEMLGFSVISDYYVYLSQSMSATQTTVPVTSMNTTDDHTITMANLGSKVFLTIDPDDDDYKELVLCTGISGTSWTGCTRGLAFYGTSTAAITANKKTHNSGAIVVMTNTHYVFEEFMDKDTDEVIGGVKKFSSYPQIETYAAPTANEEFAPKKYVDDVTAYTTGIGATSTIAVDTPTLASSDGFVIAYGTVSGSSGSEIKGMTDVANPPTSIITKGKSYTANAIVNIVFFVRNGNYYEVEVVGNFTANPTIVFIPII